MKLFKSKAGFTLIELLVVIGILAVLAAIAIPSVAGLIDRANVSADKTNSNEMTNAIERFASEYELYCQDIASGTLDPDNLDSAQGRVKNVIGATTRSGIEGIEFAQNATVADKETNKYHNDVFYKDNKNKDKEPKKKNIDEEIEKAQKDMEDLMKSIQEEMGSQNVKVVKLELPRATLKNFFIGLILSIFINTLLVVGTSGFVDVFVWENILDLVYFSLYFTLVERTLNYIFIKLFRNS